VEPELHITIAAAAPIYETGRPETMLINPFDVAHEERLVKVALLYADRVTLVSPRVAMVEDWGRLLEAAAAGRAGEVRELLRALEAGDSGLLGLLGDGVEGSALPEDALAMLDRHLRTYGSLKELTDHSPSWTGLRQAVNGGVLDVARLGHLTDYGFTPAAVLGEMVGVLARSVAPGSGTVPMMDKSSTAVFRAAWTAGVIRSTPADTAEVAIATRLVGRLPVVEDSSMDDVLRVRHELAAPLVNFRAAMSQFATQMEFSPVDTDFERDAEALFRRSVVPELQEIEELAAERKLAPRMTHQVLAAQAGTIAKAAVGIGVAIASSLPTLTQAAVGAVIAGVDIASGVYLRGKELERSQVGNKLYFLYEAPHRLQRPPRRGANRAARGTGQ